MAEADSFEIIVLLVFHIKQNNEIMISSGACHVIRLKVAISWCYTFISRFFRSESIVWKWFEQFSTAVCTHTLAIGVFRCFDKENYHHQLYSVMGVMLMFLLN